ncbi:MAG: DUF2917 domain-containing protein [Rhodospirillales bacterium]|nr:DUF2917 domain-containing protein [Rhodospirillales bacterium]
MEMTFSHVNPSQPVLLGADGVLALRDGAGSRLTVLDGAVWLTQACDPRDIALSAGQSFALDRDGLALIKAVGGRAWLAVTDPAPARRRRRARWWSRGCPPVTP